MAIKLEIQDAKGKRYPVDYILTCGDTDWLTANIYGNWENEIREMRLVIMLACKRGSLTAYPTGFPAGSYIWQDISEGQPMYDLTRPRYMVHSIYPTS